MPDDGGRHHWTDWLSRLLAWGTITLPRVAPSRWRQDDSRLSAGDLISHPFEIKADDGVRLDGWFFPAFADPHARSHQLPSSTPPRPTIIFSHGWTETKEFHLRLVRVLTAIGYPLVLYDQRGHGRSEGACTLGVREPADLRAVIDEATRRGWAGDQVLTMGVSLGGGTVLQHAPTDPRVLAVVAYAPFASFLRAIRSYGRRYAPWLSADWGVRGFIQACERRGDDLPAADAVEAVRRFTVPLLLIVGERDINLPAEDHARILHAAAPPGLSRLIEVPAATHFNICMHRWPGVDETVMEFLEAATSQRLIPFAGTALPHCLSIAQ